MSIENDLKKDGINIIKPLDTLSVTLIAKFVSEKFVSNLPFYGFKYKDLFTKISRINMYIADIPKGMAEASYFYKNSSIYFSKDLTMDQMKELAVHEFIHNLQEVKDKSGILYRLGLCDFSRIKVHGLALNEAAVQLLSSKILKKESEFVKYYNIEFSTYSATYYPMVCNLVNQLAYVFGENTLFESTLQSNDKFKNSIINLCGKKNFNLIEDNFDRLLEIEEKIILCTNKLQTEDLSEGQIARESKKLYNYKKSIRETFIKTQNLIFTSYFDNKLTALYSSQDIEDYRKKLYNYKDLLGTTEGYTYFNDYYINRMTQLDNIYESIQNNILPAVYKRSLWKILLSKLSKIFGDKVYSEENL